MLITGLFIGLLTLWIAFRFKNQKVFKYTRNFSEFESYPLVENVHLFIWKQANEVFRMVFDKIDKSTSPTKFWIFNKLMVVVSKPEDVQKILSSPECTEKESFYDLLPIPNGLIGIPPKLWRPHRKLLNPSFHISLLKSFFNDFNDVGIELCNDFKLLSIKTDIDVSPIINARSTDLAFRTFFEVKCSKDATRIMSTNINKVVHRCGEQMNLFPVYQALNNIQNIFGIKSTNRKLMDTVYSYITPVIQKNQNEYYAEVEKNGGSIDTEFKNKPEILIKKFTKLKENGYLSESFMQDHIETMLVTRADALSVTISNVLLMLAIETEVQEQCASEIKAILGEKWDYIDFEKLNELQYYDRAIKECLRLIPTVPAILRKPEIDFKLANCTIPKGVDIMISIVNLHMNKEQWGENSKKFNVDNFLPENVAKRHPGSYIPFSYGARNCMGHKYGPMALKIMIAHLLLRFKFTTKLKYDELKFILGIAIEITNERLISIENR